VAKAVALRDCQSRGELLEGVRATLARSACVAAASAEQRLSIAIQKSEDSLCADSEKTLLLEEEKRVAVDIMQHARLLLNQLIIRLANVERAFQDAKMKRACAHAAKKAAQDDINTLQLRVEGELQHALDVANRRLEEANRGVQEARCTADTELASLRHAEEAEGVVLKQAELAEALLVQLLDEARTCVVESKGDQFEAEMAPGEIEMELGGGHTGFIECAEVEVQEFEPKESCAFVVPLTMLVHQELCIVNAHMKCHEQKEKTIVNELNSRAAEWAVEKAKLHEELHKVTTSMKVAKEDFESFKQIPIGIRNSL